MSTSADVLRVGNCSGFYGDRFAAMQEMLTGGELDVLTGDYLAELTMLILARDQLRDPALGYAKTFLRQLETCLGIAVERGVRIVTNAGGAEPGRAGRCGTPARRPAGLGGRRRRTSRATTCVAVLPSWVSVNRWRPTRYLGAWGIAACLDAGADVVVTGRVTDASLVVGPAAAHFGWAAD